MVNGFGQGKVLSGLLFTFYMWSVVVPTSGIPTDQLGHLSTYMDDCFVIGHVDSVLKIEVDACHGQLWLASTTQEN
jgi:hypothetical protein